MLNCGNTNLSGYQTGRQSGISNMLCASGNLHDGVKINPPKYNAGVSGSRTQGKINLFT
jgi:hypothetical protein